MTSDVFAEQTKSDDVKGVSKDRGSSHPVQNGHDEMPGETTCILLNNNPGEHFFLLVLTKTSFMRILNPGFN